MVDEYTMRYDRYMHRSLSMLTLKDSCNPCTINIPAGQSPLRPRRRPLDRGLLRSGATLPDQMIPLSIGCALLSVSSFLSLETSIISLKHEITLQFHCPGLKRCPKNPVDRAAINEWHGRCVSCVLAGTGSYYVARQTGHASLAFAVKHRR